MDLSSSLFIHNVFSSMPVTVNCKKRNNNCSRRNHWCCEEYHLRSGWKSAWESKDWGCRGGRERGVGERNGLINRKPMEIKLAKILSRMFKFELEKLVATEINKAFKVGDSWCVMRCNYWKHLVYCILYFNLLF